MGPFNNNAFPCSQYKVINYRESSNLWPCKWAVSTLTRIPAEWLLGDSETSSGDKGGLLEEVWGGGLSPMIWASGDLEKQKQC